MSSERSNALLRNGEFTMVAMAKLDPADVDRLNKQFEGAQYLPLADFKALVDICATLLEGLGVTRTDSAVVAIDAGAAREMTLALLRVPAVIEEITSRPQPVDIAKEEARRYVVARKEAARIAEKLQPPPGYRKSPPPAISYETYRELVSQASDPILTNQILLSERPSMPVRLVTGEALPDVKPVPKALHSSVVHDVSLKVISVDERDAQAKVQIVAPVDLSGTALDGLLGVDVSLKFSSRNRAAARCLIGAQFIAQSVMCKVKLTRALRGIDWRHTCLALVRMNMTEEQRSMFSDEARQLQLQL